MSITTVLTTATSKKTHQLLKLKIGLTLFVNICCSSPNCIWSNKRRAKLLFVEPCSRSPAN